MRYPLVCLVLAWSGVARAQSVTDCSSGEAPAAYYSHTCASTCALSGYGSAKTIACTSTYLALADEDYGGIGSRKYSVYGTITNGGSNFCCYVDDSGTQNVKEIDLTGTTGSDLLTFNQAHAIEVADGHDGDDVIWTSANVTFTAGFGCSVDGGQGEDSITAFGYCGIQYGGADDDWLVGSDTSNVEQFYGEGADDFIQGNAGPDVEWGAGGRDTLEGGDDDDTLHGDGDGDFLRGNEGDDWLYGGEGADVLCSGAEGSGTRAGGAGEALWSDADGVSESPNDTDILWVPVGHTGGLFGGAQSGDYCGDTSHGSSWAGGSCSYTLTSRPADCPNE